MLSQDLTLIPHSSVNKAQQQRYQSLYERHVNALKRQGKSKSTIDVYARAVRRVTAFFDRCPDKLNVDDLKTFFSSLVKTHSWSTVKVDRNGLQFFYKHVLGKKCSALQDCRVLNSPKRYLLLISTQCPSRACSTMG